MHLSLLVHPTRAYSSFENSPIPIYIPGVLLLDRTLVHHKVTLLALHQASLKIHPYPFILLEYYYWMGHKSIARLPSQHFIRLPQQFTNTHLYSWSILLDGTLVHCKVTLPALLALLLLWSIITGWDTSPLQGYPSSISSGFPDNSPVPIYTPGWGQALWGKRVLLKNVTQCPSQVMNPGLSTHSPVHRPLGIREDILQKNLTGDFSGGFVVISLCPSVSI